MTDVEAIATNKKRWGLLNIGLLTMQQIELVFAA